jgi:hypothetical protein
MSGDSINIRPGVRMLELFASLPYKEWYAIGEFVDNAIQSYASNQDRLREIHGNDFVLRIDVEIDQEGTGRITVADNAAGISTHDWERAMRVAIPPDDTRGLSQFGVGMKAAACWFSREWQVSSAAIDEDERRWVSIDVASTVASENEEVALESVPKQGNEHGTTVSMTNLRRKPWGAGIKRIKDHLGSIYREFLRSGDVAIYYNGEAISYIDEPILIAPYWETPNDEPLEWRQEFDFHLMSGRRVHGWIGIRDKGKQSAAGLALMYRRKVIVGAGESRYKPERIFGAGNTFRSQRLLGEVDVSEFDVSHTKDSLLWGDEEDEVIERVLEILRDPEQPMYAQAENYRAHRPDPVPPRELEATGDLLRRALVELEHNAPVDEAKPAPHRGSSYLDERGVDHEVQFDTVIEGEKINVRVQLVREPGDQRWLWHVESATDASKVRIVVNRSHPFMRKFCEAPVQDLESVWLVGVAIVLGAKQGQRRGSRMTNLVVEGINSYVRRFAS